MDLGDDLRSVHFLPFPTPRKEYYDPVVERQVGRMQAVIVLVRAVRDKNTLPVKVCLCVRKGLQSADLGYRHR